MHNEEEFNFMTMLSADEVSHFRRIVTECVLATDLAKNMNWVASAKISLKGIDVGKKLTITNSSKGFIADRTETPEQIAAKLLRMQLLIKCADVR